MTTKLNIINWKLFSFLLVISVLWIIACLPYSFAMAHEAIAKSPLPFPALVVVAIIQSAILFAIVLFIWLLLAPKINLGLPILENWLDKKPINIDVKSLAKTSILLWLGSWVAIILADLFFTKLWVKISLWTGQMPPFWMGFLASFYGGICEEILLRLFFMTLLAWLFGKITRNTDTKASNGIMWTSIIIATVIFGLGHLPVTATIVELTPIVVTRAIILNWIGGIVFGWLYWKKWLESAMVAHFSADITLHVLLPIILIFSWKLF